MIKINMKMILKKKNNKKDVRLKRKDKTLKNLMHLKKVHNNKK